MALRKIRSGWAFLIAVACASSVCGHRMMEWLTGAGIFAGDYGDYDHIAVAPAGLLALALAIGGAVFAAARTSRRGHASDVAIAARELLEPRFAAIAAVVLALQLAVLLACENIEHLAAFGSPSDGLEWLGGPPEAAIGVHALIALAAAALLRRGLGSVLRTCAALFRAVCALAAYAPRLRALPVFGGRARRIARCSALLISPAAHGLRAPPRPPLALLSS